jgi:hypothetical protein
MNELIAAGLAVKAARATAGSGRPDAPVVPSRPKSAGLHVRTRAGLARGLHRVATALEPRQRAEHASPACP